MMGYCLDQNEEFGVVLIQKGREALGPLANTYPVGCTARIIQVEPLEDGRMNIAAVGVERFRILSLDRDGDYLVGTIEGLPWVNEDPDGLKVLTTGLLPRVQNYLSLLETAGGMEIDTRYLPDDPMALAHLAAYLIQAPEKDKQNLLESPNAYALLERLQTLYVREIAITRAIIDRERGDQPRFTLN